MQKQGHHDHDHPLYQGPNTNTINIESFCVFLTYDQAMKRRTKMNGNN